MPLAAAGCGNDRVESGSVFDAKPGKVTQALSYPDAGLKVTVPKEFDVKDSTAPQLFRASLDASFISAFAYRRKEQIPKEEEELRRLAAGWWLPRRGATRPSSSSAASGEGERGAGRRAAWRPDDLQGRLRLRSLHLYKGNGEYVVELVAPVAAFAGARAIQLPGDPQEPQGHGQGQAAAEEAQEEDRCQEEVEGRLGRREVRFRQREVRLGRGDGNHAAEGRLMPELPEVETIRRQLAPHMEGRVLRELEVLDPRWCQPAPARALADAVRGRRIERVSRRGKYLLVELEDEVTLVMHLRMTGNLLLVAEEEDTSEPSPSARPPALDDGRSVLFVDPRRFGTGEVLLGDDTVEEYFRARLGVEPLSPDFTADALRALARNRKAPGEGVPAHPGAGGGRRQHLRGRGALPRAPPSA